MRTQELAPRRFPPSHRRGLDAVVFQDALHRIRSDRVPEVGQSSLDSVVTPARICRRHANNQLFDFRRDRRTSRLTARVRPFPRDELPVPSKDRVRSDQSRHFLKQFPAKLLALRREPAALVIAEVEPRTELLFQNAVFLLEEFKDFLLLLVQPARQEGDQEELRRDECAHCKAS